MISNALQSLLAGADSDRDKLPAATSLWTFEAGCSEHWRAVRKRASGKRADRLCYLPKALNTLTSGYGVSGDGLYRSHLTEW